jgi:hypothetical protein
MDGLRADDQGVHIQHAFERRNNVENRAPSRRGENRTPGIRPQGNYALTNIKGLEKEIGVVKKEKSKLRHMLGIEHGNIPIQLDLWGNEVLFRGKGQTTLYGYPK